MDDLLFRGATVIDGSGGAPRSLDVAVRDGRISAVEPRRTKTAAQEIDASGRVLAPGFIDLHTHSDFTLPLNPLAESKIRQGVTTEVGSQGPAAVFAVAGRKERAVVSIKWRGRARNPGRRPRRTSRRREHSRHRAP
jgi:N-acyl-D-amino-acid deacylase